MKKLIFCLKVRQTCDGREREKDEILLQEKTENLGTKCIKFDTKLG